MLCGHCLSYLYRKRIKQVLLRGEIHGEVCSCRARIRSVEVGGPSGIIKNSGWQLKSRKKVVLSYRRTTQVRTSNQHFIRLAQTGDAGAVVGIHQRALEGSFLAKLGAGFLHQMYGYLIDREIVFVVMVGDRPAGFVSASVNPSGMMKRFVLNRPLCLLRIGLSVLKRPVLFKGVMETACAPSRPDDAGMDAEAESGVMAELLSIAIDDEHHRKGFASKLLTAMEGELKSRGVDCYKVVAGDKLDGANRFYRNSGFRLAGQIAIHGNDISNIYTKEI